MYRANALQAGSTPGWLDIFTKSNETLEKIQKNLEDYLETKRMAFPRFYFLLKQETFKLFNLTCQNALVSSVNLYSQDAFHQ
jgi:dynein heavy chain